jgi:yecA family protein
MNCHFLHSQLKSDAPMKPKARFTSRYGHIAPLLVPPNLRSFGAVAFTAHDFKVLDAWLAEEGWPAERMDAAMLEGYLVALLVWPIQLSPGAWLPAIWGVRGWKVAAKIAAPETYERFLALVIGLMQELERRLTATPPAATFVLVDQNALTSTRYFAGAAWSTGFMSALQFNANGLGSRSALSRAAVEKIIGFASLRSNVPGAMASVAGALRASVAALMDERPAGSAVRWQESRVEVDAAAALIANI